MLSENVYQSNLDLVQSELSISRTLVLAYLYVNKNNEKRKLSRVMRKPTFCICENKDADQLRGNGNREADQRL